MSLSCTILRYSEVLFENRQFEPIPPLFGGAVGVTPWEFSPDFWHQKTSPWAIIWRCLRDPAFTHFGTVRCRLVTAHYDTLRQHIPC